MCHLFKEIDYLEKWLIELNWILYSQNLLQCPDLVESGTYKYGKLSKKWFTLIEISVYHSFAKMCNLLNEIIKFQIFNTGFIEFLNWILKSRNLHMYYRSMSLRTGRKAFSWTRASWNILDLRLCFRNQFYKKSLQLRLQTAVDRYKK
jgi:hypothetical protein